MDKRAYLGANAVMLSMDSSAYVAEICRIVAENSPVPEV